MTTEGAKNFQAQTDRSNCCDFGCNQNPGCPARTGTYSPPLDALRAAQWVAGGLFVFCTVMGVIWLVAGGAK